MQGVFKPKNPKKYLGDPTNIIYRSSWELRFMQYLDTHSDVVSWASEELHVPYLSPATRKFQRYFPDFLVKIKDQKGKIRKLMIEIKPFKETQPPDINTKKKTKRMITEAKTFAVNQAKWKAAQEYCRKNGMEFKIMTERELFGEKT